MILINLFRWVVSVANYTWKLYFKGNQVLLEKVQFCELVIDRLVGFLVVEPVHLGSKSSTWHGCSYFPGFIPGFNSTMLSVVGDVSVDSKAPVVTS